jgi:hypothetical protein
LISGKALEKRNLGLLVTELIGV